MRRGDWGQWFLGLAEYVASRSKDPSTKCGAVIVRPDKTVAALGYNGFPRGVKDEKRLLNNREEKYRRVVHAEMNAILTAKEPLHGYTLYTWPFLTCERCAVHVIQAGITKVIAPKATTKEQLERWGEAFMVTRDLYDEAGVTVVEK